MWKVKRMNTAPIVVLSTADGTGGIAAYLANRTDNKPRPAEPAGQLAAMPPGIRVPGLAKTPK
jgi:hypothetical protein